MLSQAALGTLDTIIDCKGYLTDSFLHLVHTDITVKVTDDVVQRAFFWYITANILFFHHHCLRTATDERGKDILSRFNGYMRIAESFVFRF